MEGIFDSLASLPKLLTSAKDSALAPVRAGANATNKITSAIEAFNSGAVEKKIDKAVDTAEIYFATTLGLQAIATFAAVGMLIVHIRASGKRRHTTVRLTRKNRGGRR